MTSLAEALEKAAEKLDDAARLLDEVPRIGLWVRSDDCSDNRRKRQGLREADWEASDADRRMIAIARELPAAAALQAEIHALVVQLEQLPDRVSDIMGDNPGLDSDVNAACAPATELAERVRQLAALHR